MPHKSPQMPLQCVTDPWAGIRSGEMPIPAVYGQLTDRTARRENNRHICRGGARMKERGKHKTKPKFRDRQTAWWQPVEGMQQRVTVLRRNPDGRSEERRVGKEC